MVKKNIIKSLLFILFILFSVTSLWSAAPFAGASTVSWRLYDNALRAYDEGEYSSAISYAENAKINRKTELTGLVLICE